MAKIEPDRGDGLRWDAVAARLAESLREFPRHALALEGRRGAAVAVAVVPDRRGSASFLLTRRAEGLRRHRGQWALPGGRIDDGEDAAGAARRELAEELGVVLEASAEIGQLDDYPTRSGFVITPVVLVSGTHSVLRPNPEEVAAAYHIRLADLDRPDMPTLRSIPESERPVLSVPIRGGLVHSPTAAIIYQLFELAVRGRVVRVGHFEQPVFAWK